MSLKFRSHRNLIFDLSTWVIYRHSRSTSSTLRYRPLSTPIALSSSSTSSRWNLYCKLARYDKPIGSWLLFLPCTWGIGLAATPGQLPSIEMLALFAAGAVLMRGAGCTVNDLLDQKFDRQVERTKNRPLASGELSSLDAMFFLGLQLSASLLILLQLNWYSVCLGCISLVPVFTYPLFKRFTHWPQLFLGVAFNWGTLLGYSAVVGHINPVVCLPLLIAGINWTLIYDTVYAFQDIQDDLLIGVKSLAIRLGSECKPYLYLFQLGMMTSLLLVGMNSGAGWMYYSGTLFAMSRLGYLIRTTNLQDPMSCLSTFKANKYVGLIYFGGIVLDRLLTCV